jgi:hypothetical protein
MFNVMLNPWPGSRISPGAIFVLKYLVPVLIFLLLFLSFGVPLYATLLSRSCCPSPSGGLGKADAEHYAYGQ